MRQNMNLPPVFLLLMVLALDQGSKLLANALLAAREVTLFSGIVQFTRVFNYYGFLGVFNNWPDFIRTFILTGCVSVLLIVSLLYIFSRRKKNSRYVTPLSLVSGGGAGNLLDRVLNNGGVTDFVSIGYGDYRTGIFNMADAAIVIGAFMIGYIFFASPTSEDQDRATRS